MNRLDWTQIALSLGVMLIGFYIALFRHPGRGVLATTRVATRPPVRLRRGLRRFTPSGRPPGRRSASVMRSIAFW
jgi:hypothetical protein